MSAWNITASPELIAGLAKLSTMTSSNNKVTGFNSDYAKILSQKISQIENGMNETISNQRQILTNSTTAKNIEVIKKFKPDGSIMITTYEDGKIAEQTKIKPHLVPVPDYSAPLTPEGKIDTKLVPQLSLMELLMI